MECPICFVNIHENWTDRDFGQLKSEKDIYTLHTMQCPKCKNDLLLYIKIDAKRYKKADFLIPLKKNRKKLSSIIPQEFRDLYNESATVLEDSPRASAALSRTCLELLLKEYAKTKGKNLYEQIQEVIDSKNLPSDLEEMIDIVRQNGNSAVHPNKNSRELIQVEDSEAEWGLEILESLFDHYIVKPQKNKEKLEKYKMKHSKSSK